MGFRRRQVVAGGCGAVVILTFVVQGLQALHQAPLPRPAAPLMAAPIMLAARGDLARCPSLHPRDLRAKNPSGGRRVGPRQQATQGECPEPGPACHDGQPAKAIIYRNIHIRLAVGRRQQAIQQGDLGNNGRPPPAPPTHTGPACHDGQPAKAKIKIHKHPGCRSVRRVEGGGGGR